jgi:hypothetical protein
VRNRDELLRQVFANTPPFKAFLCGLPDDKFAVNPPAG